MRSYAASEADGTITLDIARAALDMAEVDRDGLDKQDRRYLETLIGVFGGGPTGVEALAATMNLPADTLSDEVEPYLLREQYIVRTPRGRNVTTRAYQLLKREPPPRPDINLQPGLFRVNPVGTRWGRPRRVPPTAIQSVTSKMHSISTAMLPGSELVPTRAPGADARVLAEHVLHQLREPVDHLRLVDEVVRAVHHARAS